MSAFSYTFSGFESCRRREVSREPRALGISAEMKRRRMLAARSLLCTELYTPEAMLWDRVDEGGCVWWNGTHREGFVLRVVEISANSCS